MPEPMSHEAFLKGLRCLISMVTRPHRYVEGGGIAFGQLTLHWRAPGFRERLQILQSSCTPSPATSGAVSAKGSFLPPTCRPILTSRECSVVVGRAPASVWHMEPTKDGRIRRIERKRTRVNHYTFHI
jgi:hypothetical protein